MKLQGKVAIVTGGGKGIGRAFASRLAADGAAVVIADVGPHEDAVAELKGRGASVLGLNVDISAEADTERMAAETLRAFGRIDILLNNAALFAEVAVRPFEEIPVAEWKRVMEVNILGLALCCKAVAPQMRKQKSGRIINMGSTVTLTGVPFFAHYLATKGAVHAMTRGLARELGKDNITINTVAPGLTLSEGVLQHRAIRTLHMNQHDEIIKRRAIARAQYPDDLVGTASFLASDDAAFITGQTIVVDGGTAML